MTNPPKQKFRQLELAARAASLLGHQSCSVAGHPAFQWPLASKIGLSSRVGRTADGCEIVDQSGRRLVDWTGNPAGRLIGYRHPLVLDAVSRWVSDEASSPLERIDSSDGPLVDPGLAKIIRQLRPLFPGNRCVALAGNRDTSVRRAIEIARSITGRQRVLFISQCQNPNLKQQSPIAKAEREQFGDLVDNAGATTRLSFNQIDAIRNAVSDASGSLAAIFMEPFRYAIPHADFFTQLIESLGNANANSGPLPLFIVDESATAFRIADAGAQQYFGFKPDLTIAGESLGGPIPFSAVLARESLATGGSKLPSTQVTVPAGLSVATVNATLQAMSDLDLPERLLAAGEEVSDNFQQSCSTWNLPGSLLGHASRMLIRFESVDNVNGQQILQRFCYAAMQHGALTFGELWPSGAMTDEAVERTVCALESAAAETSKWLTLKKSSNSSLVPSCQYAVKGRVDSLNMIRKSLLLSGWILLDDQPLDRLEALDEHDATHDAETFQRPDLIAGFPQIENVAAAGFRLTVPIDSVKQTSRFMLRGYRGNKIVYQTLLVHDPSRQTSGPYPFSGEALLT